MRQFPTYLLLALVMTIYPSSPKAFEVTQARTAARPSNQASTDWVGFAVSRNGRVFVSDFFGAEGAVRADARSQCEAGSLRSCRAIAVQVQTDVTAITCSAYGQQDSFIGGSNIDRGAADWLANQKAREAGFDAEDCRTVFEY